jgi:putative transposase
MPDHLHTIWTLPLDDSDFSARWKRIKAYFTHRLVAAGVPVERRRNGEYALWQRRFWEHTIRNEIDFERHVDYVHFNPVKHKLVSRVGDWPYSSFHVYVRRGVLPADWAGDVGESTRDFGERRG